MDSAKAGTPFLPGAYGYLAQETVHGHTTQDTHHSIGAS